LEAIDRLGISAVVSVLKDPHTLSHPSLHKCQHLTIDLEDTDDTDLLCHLPDTYTFIHRALSQKKKSIGNGNTSSSSSPSSSPAVLIHCAQGVSRSASIATAYIMKSQSQPYLTALSLLQQSHPTALPNSNFAYQLHLYHTMGCQLTSTGNNNVAYRRHLLKQTAKEYKETGTINESSLLELTTDDTSATLYRCRKCRNLVATSGNVVEVEKGAGEVAFSWRKRDAVITGELELEKGVDASVYSSCPLQQEQQQQQQEQFSSSSSSSSGGGDSLFVQPLKWMASSVMGHNIQGKLYCPKCSARLGAFHWAGAQSATGTWVTPAFRLHLSRLDEERPRQVNMNNSNTGGGGGSIARPKFLRQRLEKETEKSAVIVPPQPSSSSSYFTHLILDCDGVMVDSEAASCEALRLAILQVTGLDIPHIFPQDYVPVFGMDVTGCVAYYKDRFNMRGGAWGGEGKDADQVVAIKVSAAKKEIYEDLTAKQGIKAFPGVAELINSATKLGMGVAVASSGSPSKILHNLESSGLLTLFPDRHLLVSAEYVAAGKPAPDVYIEAMQRVGYTSNGGSSNKVIVVEDAVNGIIAAKSAGCYCVGITNQLPREVLEKYADVVVDKLEEIYIEKLGREIERKE
jgi:dual specificity phosphatase 12